MPTDTALSIDVLSDLASTTALKSLLTSQQDAIFNIAEEVAKFATEPVKDAAAVKASAQLTLTAPASWTLPNGIVFSLAANASCTITIDTVSETFTIATALDSDATTDVVATTPANAVYINLELDFSIQGSASASGNFDGVGVAGSAAGGTSATLIFCQPVDGSLLTLEAITKAFSDIVFPLHPTSARDMQTGALTRVLFDGGFNAELDVTFGLGDHTFAAPSVGAALASLQKVVGIAPPQVVVNGGATGSVTFAHTGHFALLVDKPSADAATVYLVRALETDLGVTAGVTVGVTTSNISVSVDPTALQTAVKQITGSDLLATAVVDAASQPINNLTSSLNAKLASLAAKVTGEIDVNAGLALNTSRTALYVFDVDLTVASALTEASWTALIAGSLRQALNAGGLRLQPGSGISDSLKRSATFHFQFFNLFSFDHVEDFFRTATAVLGPDGTIRLHATFGQEASNTTAKTLDAIRIYFVVGATENSAGGVSLADVDLRIELSEAGTKRKGATFAQTLAMQPQQPAATAIQGSIGSYLAAHPAGNVTLVYDIKPSAYSKLAFTPFIGNHAPPLPHAADQANWEVFKAATTQLMPDLVNLVSPLTFGTWVTFNRTAIDQPGSTVNPDRHQTGDTDAGVATLGGAAPALAGFFLQASQGFMNLMEDLATLATSAANVTDEPRYNRLLAFLTQVITQDVFLAYGVPTAAALVHQLGIPTASVAGVAIPATDGSALTCTVTIG